MKLCSVDVNSFPGTRRLACLVGNTHWASWAVRMVKVVGIMCADLEVRFDVVQKQKTRTMNP